MSSLSLKSTDIDISKTAHTVTNLLTNLKLSTNQLLIEDSPKAIELYVKNADATINSAVSAIRHMVLLERLEANILSPKLNNIDVTKIVFDVMDRKRFQWDGTSLKLHGARAIKNTDALFLEAILSELIDNSCRYKSKNVDISVESSKNNTRILIEDDGEGIETNELAKVFDPYYRIAKHRKRSNRAGLGLTTARTAVNKLGGDIRLHSHPNWGTKVEILL